MPELNKHDRTPDAQLSAGHVINSASAAQMAGGRIGRGAGQPMYTTFA